MTMEQTDKILEAFEKTFDEEFECEREHCERRFTF